MVIARAASFRPGSTVFAPSPSGRMTHGCVPAQSAEGGLVHDSLTPFPAAVPTDASVLARAIRRVRPSSDTGRPVMAR